MPIIKTILMGGSDFLYFKKSAFLCGFQLSRKGVGER